MASKDMAAQERARPRQNEGNACRFVPRRIHAIVHAFPTYRYGGHQRAVTMPGVVAEGTHHVGCLLQREARSCSQCFLVPHERWRLRRLAGDTRQHGVNDVVHAVTAALSYPPALQKILSRKHRRELLSCSLQSIRW